jgi:anti-sigma B factor antagonist
MQITEHWHGTTAVIAFADPLDLDARTGPRLREMAWQVAEEGAETLVLDLAKVGFVDSAGLGALLSAHKALRAKGHRLVLANLNEEIRQILEVTSLCRVFEVAAAPGVPAAGR